MYYKKTNISNECQNSLYSKRGSMFNDSINSINYKETTTSDDSNVDDL